MPAQDGILEKGYLGDLNPDLARSAPSRLFKWLLHLARPSFTVHPNGNGHNNKLGRTAYLDGLRGFAAFIVYWHHHNLWARGIASGVFENGYGYMGKHYFVALPFVRNFFSGGHFAVSIFFVISGYVLSAKPVALIQAGDHVKLGDNLASALFRRWIRLYIPLIATTILYVFWFHTFGLGVIAKKKDTIGAELWEWYAEFKNFSFVYRTSGEPWFTYNFHTWSIPVEFKGSVIIYTCLLAFSRGTRNARLLLTIGMIVYFMYIVDGAHYSMFLAGMLLAEIDTLAMNDNLPHFFKAFEASKQYIFYGFFIVAMYLGGVPSIDQDTRNLAKSPGWYYLSFLKPQAIFDYKWFYLFWAAVFMVSCIPRIPLLRRFFETRFNLYLGRISFALYLVHGPVLWIVGDRMYAAVGWYREDNMLHTPKWVNAFPIPRIGPLGLETDFWPCHLVLLPLTLWLAEVVTRMFDEPSVKFARWIYTSTLEEENKR
ncbi:hypothetical protein P152DRAFT_459500 [Eremomyces bilateralis CBS 781.70]|uniref:Acyltransferase 3 domain-containing protein n=1 Tax=Eremomyces bilateralis CBS 781.70 TaxID=1392243 RepID=A0A6G1G0U5_9PEZI|nr:uncharacterized protein P152DRAFT_459500 [Eremomyces bilateralis CBS 781.70]KAF1811551.1 hypothetical protein P152DRAFT_459500 [Eremomyces bilateralis CBS 781.70]